jgi:hypothetical protein
MLGILHKPYHSPFWQNLKLEVRKPDAAVREIRETPTFAHSDLCDCVPLSAYRNLIRAEHAQFCAANNALAVFLNLLSYHFDLRFQRRAVVPNVFGERVQTLRYSILARFQIKTSEPAWKFRRSNPRGKNDQTRPRSPRERLNTLGGDFGTCESARVKVEITAWA